MDRSKWEYKKLGEVAKFIGGGTPSKANEDYYTGNIPWATVRDMANFNLSKTDLCITELAVKESATNIVPKDTIVISTHVGLGKICLLMQDTAINQDLKGVILPQSVDKMFFAAWYKSIADYVISNGKGATVKGVTMKFVNDLKIPVPPISDQQRIVAELDCLNEMIALKQEQLKEFDKLAQSIFYDMFGDKDFPMYQLKDILSKIGSGATPSGGNQSYKTEGISLIRSLNVHNNLFVYKDLAFIDEQQAKQLNNVTIEEGDVLLNITGASVARCCVVPNDVIPARVNQHVSILRPRKELLDSLYLCHFLISCDEQAKLLSLSRSKAATREALPKNLLEKYSVPLPSLALQQQFAEKIQAIEAQKELVKQSIAETQQLLDSRMDYYFN